MRGYPLSWEKNRSKKAASQTEAAFHYWKRQIAPWKEHLRNYITFGQSEWGLFPGILGAHKTVCSKAETSEPLLLLPVFQAVFLKD
jgi:hypothetical protein